LVDENTVLVTHSPALGTLDSGILGRHVGSSSIRDLISSRRPLAHIHGHSHASFGRQGRHFNVASARNKRAMLIDLDSMSHWVIDGSTSGLAGREPSTDEGANATPRP
jgi:Icc-related predicted phosphoesterase